MEEEQLNQLIEKIITKSIEKTTMEEEQIEDIATEISHSEPSECSERNIAAESSGSELGGSSESNDEINIEFVVDPKKSKNRHLIVADMLPVVAVRESDGSWSFKDTPGYIYHLYQGLKLRQNILWIGCLLMHHDSEGAYTNFLDHERLSDNEKMELRLILEEKRCYPIFINKAELQQWRRYCSVVLYPLLHYSSFELRDIFDMDECYTGYDHACGCFGDEIKRVHKAGDTLLIMDYKLMLLPKMICSFHGIRIGWFCNTPFPPHGVLETLPTLVELMDGILHSDVVGFHSADYVTHFLDTCKLTLFVELKEENLVVYQKAYIRVKVLPLGIQVEKFCEAFDLTEVQSLIDPAGFKNKNVILSVNKIDKSEGIIEKLVAYTNLIKDPFWYGKVVFILILSPVETILRDHYEDLRRYIYNLVGTINQKYRSEDFLPIACREAWEVEQIAPFYMLADLYLAMPLRDGMNVTALEFLAMQYHKQNKGKIIMSPFTAATKITEGFFDNAVNPRNAEGFAEMMKTELQSTCMYEEEAYKSLRKYRPSKWLKHFVSAMWDDQQIFNSPREKEFFLLGQVRGRNSKLTLAYVFEENWERAHHDIEIFRNLVASDFPRPDRGLYRDKYILENMETLERFLSVDRYVALYKELNGGLIQIEDDEGF